MVFVDDSEESISEDEGFSLFHFLKIYELERICVHLLAVVGDQVNGVI